MIKATTKYKSKITYPNLMNNELMAAGMTVSESKLYNALIDLGKANAGNLSRKTRIHRRNVYDALERLIEKGFVSFIKENKKRFYVPSDPKKILDTLEEKRDAFLNVLPVLQSKFDSVKHKQETLFYKGIEGVKNVFEDQLNEGKEILVISTANYARVSLPYYIKHYKNKRMEKKLHMKIIYFGGEKGKTIEHTEIRHLPKHYGSPVSTNIYGDNAAVIVWGKEPVAILIKNKEVAHAFRNYFELLWDIAK